MPVIGKAANTYINTIIHHNKGNLDEGKYNKVQIMMKVHVRLKYFVHAYVSFEKGSK